MKVHLFCCDCIELFTIFFFKTVMNLIKTCRMSGRWKVDSRKLAAAVAKAKNEDLTESEKEAITSAAMRQNLKQQQENKERLIRLIKQAAKSRGLADLRKTIPEGENEIEQKEQEMLFESFCSNCLVHMRTKKYWNDNYLNDPMSKMYSAADEAMAMVAMENVAPELLELMTANDNSIEKPNSLCKYTGTKKWDGSGKIRGWHSTGINRYNYLLREVIKNRGNQRSKELDDKLKVEYRDEGLAEQGDEALAEMMQRGLYADDTVAAEMPIDMFDY